MSTKIHMSELSDEDLAEALVSVLNQILDRHLRDELSLGCELADGSRMMVTVARGGAAVALENEIKRNALAVQGLQRETAH